MQCQLLVIRDMPADPGPRDVVDIHETTTCHGSWRMAIFYFVPSTKARHESKRIPIGVSLFRCGEGHCSEVSHNICCDCSSWVDSLPIISQRLPVVESQVFAHISIDQRAIGCFGRVAGINKKLDDEGFVSRLEWTVA